MKIVWRNPNPINRTSFSIVKTSAVEQPDELPVLHRSSRGPGAPGTIFEVLVNRDAVSQAAQSKCQPFGFFLQAHVLYCRAPRSGNAAFLARGPARFAFQSFLAIASRGGPLEESQSRSKGQVYSPRLPRMHQQELIRGTALNSQADTTTAQEYDAKALLLESQFDCFEAYDEVVHAMGGTVQ
jgi:hypothetical protein